ncbi:DUF4369 domain-containing protein [Myroides sp. M-43]|uniref:DUF4369 domain-containing protein n=1 Tax=Myroides oncorhynchi TaxID=2893756 RepID=UPI001E3BFA55|nr:DUF4369 domain-containing protein [Myroides oncorhynchi]MCC9044088.1 DUF4369 domain-containing protein [Myroides oncorhynchi]
MKKLIFVFVSILFFISCQKKNSIELTVVDIPENTNVYICIRETIDSDSLVLSSGTIKDGKVTFKNPFVEVNEAFISIKEGDKVDDKILFVGEPGNITVFFDKKNPKDYKVKGTENNEKYQNSLKEIQSASIKYSDFFDLNESKMMTLPEDSEELKRLRKNGST